MDVSDPTGSLFPMGGEERRDASARPEIRMRILGLSAWNQRGATLLQVGSGAGYLVKEFGGKSLSVKWGRRCFAIMAVGFLQVLGVATPHHWW